MVSGKVTSSARTGRAQRTKPRRAAPRPIVHPVKTRKPNPHQTGAGLSGRDPAASYSPTRRPCSTIGAGGLNGRVRDGNGCFPSAITAGNRIVNLDGQRREQASGGSPRQEIMVKPHGHLVPVSSTPYGAST